ncbi:MAG: hypothetical protein WBS22_13895 [Methylocystis sp.]
MIEQLIPLTKDIAVNVVANLIGAAIVIGIGFLSFKRASMILQTLKYARRMSKNGFVNFYNSRSEYYTSRRQVTWEKYVLTTNKEFIYVGFYLSAATDTSMVDGALKALLERGCRIELILLDDCLDQRLANIMENYLGIAAGTLIPRLRHAHDHFAKLRATLGADEQTRFIVRRHQNMITSSAMFLDWGEPEGKLLIDTKIAGAGRDKSFGMEFRNTGKEATLSLELAMSFRRIANGATPAQIQSVFPTH